MDYVKILQATLTGFNQLLGTAEYYLIYMEWGTDLKIH